MEVAVKKLALVLAFSLVAGSAFAQGTTCKAGAVGSDGKALAGAALSARMKKCEGDAKKSCDDEAASKKLNGAAKTSFTKKCVTDKVGA
jgi:hypothetical protein